jgi:hypothetical protein
MTFAEQLRETANKQNEATSVFHPPHLESIKELVESAAKSGLYERVVLQTSIASRDGVPVNLAALARHIQSEWGMIANVQGPTLVLDWSLKTPRAAGR